MVEKGGHFTWTKRQKKIESSPLLVGRPAIKAQFNPLTAFTKRQWGTRRQFSENICPEDDLRSRIFGTFVEKFLACLPLLGFSNM